MIGIAMTTYNGERFLRAQIDSILNQTYTDFELIVCDDGSTDSTIDILNEYSKKDSRVHIFQNKNNLGVIKNFEKAIRICLERGAEYITLSDQDDIWIQDYLKILYELQIQNQNCLVTYGARFSFVNSIPQIQYINKKLDSDFTPLERLNIALHRDGIFIGATMLIHKDFFLYALPIDENFGMHDIWFVALAEALQSTAGTNRIISYYRRHNTNVTNGKSFNQKMSLILGRKKLTDRYYRIKGILKRLPPDLLDPLIINELNIALKYYTYKKFFLFRLAYFPFFIKRYKVFTYRINPVYACLKFLFWG